MWTVANLVERLSDRFQFFIVTRNHDNRNDLMPFSDVPTGQWVAHGRAEVMYLAPQDLTSKKAAILVNEIRPDCVFLNSVFSKPVRKFLTAQRRSLIPALPAIVAPCGELSPGALLQKLVKKWLYYNTAKPLGMYSDVTWKASSKTEAG